MGHVHASERTDFQALPLVSLLRELAEVVRPLLPQQYNHHDALMEGSVGGHVRHCLDHVSALVGAAEAAGDGRRAAGDLDLDYDVRRRGTPIEHDPAAACAAMAELVQRLTAVDPSCWNRTVRVHLALTTTMPAAAVLSTLGRELAFVLSHSVHHNAMIRVMVRSLGREVPKTFGYAPSTLAYLSGSAAQPDVNRGG
jgi:hypothetical protein